jgi:acyl dehydratase
MARRPEVIDRESHVGIVSEPRIVDIEAGFLKFFAKATGETNPIYFDEGAARAAGHPAIPIPPTYLFSLQMSSPAKRGDIFDKRGGLGVDMMKMLHADQGFTYYRPIHAGDRITITTTTEDIYARKGGALEFIVQTTRFEKDDGELCAESRQVAVVRNG